MTDTDKVPAWLKSWVPEPWRKPDKFNKYPGHYQAVWYSGRGKHNYDDKRPSESSSAAAVELSDSDFLFTEYTHISEWYMDEPYDPIEHGDFWRMQMVDFAPDQVKRLIATGVQQYRREQQEAWGEQVEPEFLDVPANRFRLPRKPIEIAAWVASLGSAVVSYQGGEEDETEALP